METRHSAAVRLLARPDPRLVLWALSAYLFVLGGVFVAL